MNSQRLPIIVGSLFACSLSACSPVIAIPAGSEVSNLILSRTTPDASFEGFTFDGRRLDPPYFSFDIPTGPHAVSVRYVVDAVDRCDSRESSCSVTRTNVTCSGSFKAEANVRYRILLDPRSSPLKATIHRREGSSLYIGQEEGVVSTLTCDIMSREERRSYVPS